MSSFTVIASKTTTATAKRKVVFGVSSELREILELDFSDVPDYSTIYKAFDRLEMRVWRVLLR